MTTFTNAANGAVAAIGSLAVAFGGFAAGLALAAVALPVAARAQVADPPPKTRSVVVYGDDTCPPSTSDEIVVCARQPEGDRYRIPKQFRGKKGSSPAGNSFANKNRAIEGDSRQAAGLPNTCSAVGSGGQTGCFLQMQQQAAAWRQQQKTQTQDGDTPQ